MLDSTPVEFQTEALEPDEHQALKALKTGTATEYQQVLALKVIVNKLARTYDVLYVPGSETGSAFLSGRAYVGQQLTKYLTLPVTTKEERTNG